jgi:hypothetical protein
LRHDVFLSTETLETKRIPNGADCLEPGQPAFSHSGDHLAYWCQRSEYEGDAGLYSLRLPDGKPKMIGPFWAYPHGLTWSADDEKLIYSLWNTSSFQLGEVTVANGSVKRLALEGAELPTFSQGDKRLLDIFRVQWRLRRRRDSDRFPQESFDGKTVYFANHGDNSTLKKTALPGQPGTESEVDGLPPLRNSKVWTVSSGGIYFVPAEAPRSVRYFDFASKRIRPIFEVDRDLGDGLSVSPDGRWIIYSQVADVNSDIMLVDNFR